MSKQKISFKEAAARILEEASEPMSAKAITVIALEKELIETEGVTPEATMGAIIYSDISSNSDSVFEKVGPGLFALKSKQGSSSPIVFVDKQNKKAVNELKQILLSIDPYQFEYLIADLLQKIGFENVVVTKRSGDKGIDVIANLTVGGITNVKTVIQAKRYKDGNKVDGKVITQLRGSAAVDQRGLVITTSDFTKDAVEESKALNKMPVSLINGEKLLNLLVKSDIGIKKQILTLISLHHGYFENEPGTAIRKIDDEKSRSIWPLPGGINSYVESLNEILAAVNSKINTKEKIVNWIIKTYENVESKKTAQGYANVPRNMGLIEFMDGIYKLTEDGAKYLHSKDKDLLYKIISANILAFDDIYEFIKTAQKPQNEESILKFLKDNFNIDWETYAQVNFRLLWLVNLGKLRKTEDGYICV